jgi:hypothetical protein
MECGFLRVEKRELVLMSGGAKFAFVREGFRSLACAKEVGECFT